uniref:Uncharacterized protein n=1 Tax=Oryza glumipatula TaxID=40148 RepID=A0A0D9ZCZ4_9ORYZ
MTQKVIICMCFSFDSCLQIDSHCRRRCHTKRRLGRSSVADSLPLGCVHHLPDSPAVYLISVIGPLCLMVL